MMYIDDTLSDFEFVSERDFIPTSRPAFYPMSLPKEQDNDKYSIPYVPKPVRELKKKKQGTKKKENKPKENKKKRETTQEPERISVKQPIQLDDNGCPKEKDYDKLCASLIPGWSQYTKSGGSRALLQKLRSNTHPDKHLLPGNPMHPYKHCIDFSNHCFQAVDKASKKHK